MIEVEEVASRAASAWREMPRCLTPLLICTSGSEQQEATRDADNTVSCVLIDEAQFLTKTQSGS